MFGAAIEGRWRPKCWQAGKQNRAESEETETSLVVVFLDVVVDVLVAIVVDQGAEATCLDAGKEQVSLVVSCCRHHQNVNHEDEGTRAGCVHSPRL